MSRDLTALRQLQSLPLEAKIERSKRLISEWLETYPEAYISFSGGKDSTVLLDLARQVDRSVKAVFCDTGLEYPEIKEFVKKQDNVEIIKPTMNFREVIIKYGYPFISKEVAQTVCQARKNLTTGKYTYRMAKLNGTARDKDGNLSQYNIPKYKPLLDTDFVISHECCNVIKKTPFKKHSNAIIGMTADESRLREQHWVKYGCNAFNNKQPKSNPLMVWTEQDILFYIKQKDLKIADVYGEIVKTDDTQQMCMYGDLRCSGVQRTGCIFCGFGAHLDTRKGGVSRFVMLKKSHPKLYDYCMCGGEFVDGIWQPTDNGLGMAYVIDGLNRLYSKKLKSGKLKTFIEY